MTHQDQPTLLFDDFRQMASANGMAASIIVFSHLRWNFVTQRPQHLISRLAETRKVLFVEEPIPFEEGEQGTANILQVHQNIVILQPKIDPARLIDELETLVSKHSQYFYPQPPILWFYSAAFHEMSERLNQALVVYDCMDELSAFKGAPQALVDQERVLLKKADLVFTGGKSLFEAKRLLSDEVYCYPSSVDSGHFEKALEEDTAIPTDIEDIPHPIAGYYGVIDERIDYDLLAEVARMNPDLSFVMIGPVVKVAESDLPQAENIYYLGSKPYNELPGYLKAFDIAMMPFALNDSTRFISPTKTLEYLAAEKPVISTPIYDVVRDYSHVLPIAENAREFTAALQSFLEEGPEKKEIRKRKYREILQAVSWDKTVAAMQKNIQELLAASASGVRRKQPAL